MMQDIGTLMGGHRDADGVLHIAPSTPGCPHCGATEAKAHQVDGRTIAVLYHPGAECCAERLTQQITWRSRELDRIQATINERYEAIQVIEDAAETAYGKEAAAMRAKAERARAGMRHVVEALREKAEAIMSERDRLQKRRGWLSRSPEDRDAARAAIDRSTGS